MMRSNGLRTRLRRFLAVGLAAGTVGLAGCGQEGAGSVSLLDGVPRLRQITTPAVGQAKARGRSRRNRLDSLPRKSVKQMVGQKYRTA